MESRSMKKLKTSDDEEERQKDLWIGMDMSTQSLTIVALSDTTSKKTKLEYHNCIKFDEALPHYWTNHGMHVGGKEGIEVTSPAPMWLEALDMGLARLGAWLAAANGGGGGGGGGAGFAARAISVSGQQHGTVYWARGARSALAEVLGEAQAAAVGDPVGEAGVSRSAEIHTSLLEAFGGGARLFAVRDSPIWADASAGAEAAAFERALGGAQALATSTGGKAYLRHSGPQMRKIAQKKSEAWENTERVSLVSSFVTSLLIGDYAPIDTSDGSGMNLMDIHTKTWKIEATATVSDSLSTKQGVRDMLGARPVGAHLRAGALAPGLARRHRLPRECTVISGSGDNPNALAGLGMSEEAEGVYAVSLGTSDTIMAITSSPDPQVIGNVMVNPVDPTSYFAMLVYKNGALARQKVCDLHCNGNWEKFGHFLEQTEPGNNGQIGLYLSLPEITPEINCVGDIRVDGTGTRVAAFPPAADVRAVVEGRFLSMRARMTTMGVPRPSLLVATGGASANRAILQVMADVFGVPVFSASISDAAAVGAAYRAKHGWLFSIHSQVTEVNDKLPVPFSDVIGTFEERGILKVCEPLCSDDAYPEEFLERYAALEEMMATTSSSTEQQNDR